VRAAIQGQERDYDTKYCTVLVSKVLENQRRARNTFPRVMSNWSGPSSPCEEDYKDQEFERKSGSQKRLTIVVESSKLEAWS
jgi:hypothetical protein